MVNAIMEGRGTLSDETERGASFERDTVTWAFAKLAEHVLDELFRESAERRRYSSWLEHEAPSLAASAQAEQGLVLVDVDLGADGSFQVIARPCEGEFIFTVRHQRFSVVLASAYAALAAQPEQECICVAHFEGDAALAARWASSLRHSLARRAAPVVALSGACLH